MANVEEIKLKEFERKEELAQSTFRSKFKLDLKDKNYIEKIG